MQMHHQTETIERMQTCHWLHSIPSNPRRQQLRMQVALEQPLLLPAATRCEAQRLIDATLQQQLLLLLLWGWLDGDGRGAGMTKGASS